ncbi:MAG: alpha/beta fold hydrolase [Hungatella sp.]
METNFEGQTVYGAPVIFVEGRHDFHVSSELAKEYYDTIQSEKQFHWFEHSCHFPQWSEPEKFHKLMLELPG